MTQFQHTLKQLLTGEKTETSRIVKEGDYTWMCGEMPASWSQLGTAMLYSQVWRAGKKNDSYFVAFEQDKTYAIQPARGVKSVGRYKVERIWRQDVRKLNLGEIEREGFELWTDFWEVWCAMHDPKLSKSTFRDEDGWKRSPYAVHCDLLNRPAERYQAWRMKIQVLWETVDWDAPAVRALQIESKRI